MSESTTLEGLAPGEFAAVVGVDGDDEVSQRLIDLGFWPGTRVRMVRRAPLGDPIQYSLRGFDLALRATEARRVKVERDSGVQA